MLMRSLIDIVSCGAVLLIWKVGELIVKKIKETKMAKNG